MAILVLFTVSLGSVSLLSHRRVTIFAQNEVCEFYPISNTGTTLKGTSAQPAWTGGTITQTKNCFNFHLLQSSMGYFKGQFWDHFIHFLYAPIR